MKKLGPSAAEDLAVIRFDAPSPECEPETQASSIRAALLERPKQFAGIANGKVSGTGLSEGGGTCVTNPPSTGRAGLNSVSESPDPLHHQHEALKRPFDMAEHEEHRFRLRAFRDKIRTFRARLRADP
jgi:hypothetical protein